jgi:hypothetical protein
MDSTTIIRPPPPHSQALPPITALTSLSDSKEGSLSYSSLPIRPSDPRDSGNWSQSKRNSLPPSHDLKDKTNCPQIPLVFLTMAFSYIRFSIQRTLPQEIRYLRSHCPLRAACTYAPKYPIFYPLHLTSIASYITFSQLWF